MKFRLIENLLDEDFEVAPGITFRDLMNAAEDENGDFILNPPGVDGVIELPEDKWNKFYDTVFKVEEDTTYTPEEYAEEVKFEKAFDKRYRCV